MKSKGLLSEYKFDKLFNNQEAFLQLQYFILSAKQVYKYNKL